MNNSSNFSFGDTKEVSQFLQRGISFCISLSNLLGLGISDFRMTVLFPRRTMFNTVGVSTFANHIGNIISLGTEKKMGGVDAVHHITAVKNVHARGNGAIGKFKRKAVGVDLLTGRWSKFPITGTVSVSGGIPKPAGFSLLNFGPESFFGGISDRILHAIPSFQGVVMPPVTPITRGLFMLSEFNYITLQGNNLMMKLSKSTADAPITGANLPVTTASGSAGTYTYSTDLTFGLFTL